MSCEACATTIDCLEFGGVSSDFSPDTGFFPTQGYTFVLDCPPGFFCFPGYWPRVINITKDHIPPVTITNGGQMFLLGCNSMLSVAIPDGSTPAQIKALADSLFRAWALQQAQCINVGTGPAPGIPPPLRIPTGLGARVTVTNDEQCFTAHCNPESSGDPATDCVEPGYYEQTLFNATPEQVAALMAQFNADALAVATAGAYAKLTCGICNAALHYFVNCPGDPSKVADVDIAAGTYCVAPGTPNGQAIVDAKANVDANNQAHALLNGLGCPCPGVTVTGGGGPGLVNSACDLCGTWNLNSPFNVCIGPSYGGAFDPDAQFFAYNGSHIHNSTSILNLGPVQVKMYYP